MCVSSRPWNAFMKAYDKNTDCRIVMQDLTQQDMHNYIKGTLEKNDRFLQLTARDPSAAILTREIRNRAHRVFLCVYLTVRSILNGLTEDDDMAELQRRLHAIPDTLEESFRAMLKSVGKIYQRPMARALLIASVAEEPLSLLSYHYMELDSEDPNSALEARCEPLGDDYFEKARARTKACLNKWCRGRLELAHEPREFAESIRRDEVVFLHRTVEDFLQTDEVRKILRSQAEANFQPEITIARVYLHHVKESLFTGRHNSYLESIELTSRIMRYLKRCEVLYRDTWIAMMLELDRVRTALQSSSHLGYCISRSSHWEYCICRRYGMKGKYYYEPHDTRWRVSFLVCRGRRDILAYAVEFDLVLFMTEWLLGPSKDTPRADDAPLLHCALYPRAPPLLELSPDLPSLSMTKLLLEMDADPNEPLETCGRLTAV